ncbi:arylesterase [Rhodothermus marinus]|uniref:Lipolytic protein G-D-S-L family n=1 Tax=Rhodothermus marinus (strain ATCC 43812 / DSM 4252 / R-10) TaxID=518766 RepID=D0MEZ1_RHOM4|nr:arylesterase [Rhodothermus marinus]ACY47441.1 lipolytic protein G-D-S-L family [Rhodothermus marinus DSM 4252]
MYRFDLLITGLTDSVLKLLLLPLLMLLAACGGAPEPPRSEASPDTTAPAVRNTARAERTINVLVLGNSLAAGYGLSPDEAFPAVLQRKVDSLGWPVRIINAGLSGETSAGGLRRIEWLLRERIDVLILELGANDGLRGIDPEVTRRNLQGIIDKVRARYPDADIILAGMQLPPNLGPDYTAAFRAIYPELARANDAHLIPFLLEGVGGVPELNQADGIHPTAEGQRIVAENVWRVLRPVLERQLSRPTRNAS